MASLSDIQLSGVWNKIDPILPKLLLVMIFIPAKETYNKIVSVEDFTSLFELHSKIITF